VYISNVSVVYEKNAVSRQDQDRPNFSCTSLAEMLAGDLKKVRRCEQDRNELSPTTL